MKRKINLKLGNHTYSFLTDEPKDKVQEIKEIIDNDYEKYSNIIESNDKKDLTDLLVLLLLNHVSKELQHKEELKDLKDKNERLMVEIERLKTEREDMAG